MRIPVAVVAMEPAVI